MAQEQPEEVLQDNADIEEAELPEAAEVHGDEVMSGDVTEGAAAAEPVTISEASQDDEEEVAEDVTEAADSLAQLSQQLSEMREQLTEAEQQAAEYLEGWRRVQASFVNFRRRMEQEQEQIRAQANAALITRLLPVLDDFSRAFENLPEELEDHPWLDGILLIRRKLLSILKNENVAAIEVEAGDEFDPRYHQAVFRQESGEFADDQIITEVQTGYMLGERVLRPSMVVVAKAQPAPQGEVIEGEVVTPVVEETEEGEGVVSPEDVVVGEVVAEATEEEAAAAEVEDTVEFVEGEIIEEDE